MLVKVYELRDPRDETKSPRYVGITVKLLKNRLCAHLNPKKLIPNNHKNTWIKSLLKLGIKPTIHLIEEVEGYDYACKVEQYWIKEFKEQGYNITNSTDGGEGLKGYIASEETKEKLKKASISNYYKCMPYIYTEIPVYLYTIKGCFIKYFKSQSECSRYLNISPNSISACLIGKQNSLCRNKYIVTLKDDELDVINKIQKYKEGLLLKSKNTSTANSRKIIQKTINGDIIKIWNKASDASNTLNIDLSTIIKCCRNKVKTSHKFKWEYYE